jgi:hypothetical protein
MPLRPRDVLRIWDRYTSPNKRKLHICVCPDMQLFLRINSDPIFQPAHPISKANNAFLHHDSFVELQQLVRHWNDDIRDAEHIGRISKSEAKGLNDAAQQAKTLTPEHKRIITENLIDDSSDPKAAPL